MDLQGLVIRVKNAASPPPKALLLSHALNKAGISHKVVTRTGLYEGMQIPDDYFDLGIGRKALDEVSTTR
jgi:hypothetical protein